MTDSVPSTPAPSDEGPPTSGQVEEQPAVVGSYAFRRRAGMAGVEYCVLGDAGDLVGPWVPFVPLAHLSLTTVRDQIAHAMFLLSARLLACPTGSGGVPGELAHLASALRDLGAD